MARFILTISILVFCRISALYAQDQTVGFSVTVRDSIHDMPLAHARIELRRGTTLIAGRITTPTGKADFKDIHEGWYTIKINYVNYSPFTDSILIDRSNRSMTISLIEEEHQDVIVEGSTLPNVSTIDIKNGNQVFEASTYHAPPSSRITTLLQENMLGAARATTGEVHIRGQHGEYTYYVDGIPIPLGVFGGLNEVVDGHVIDRATFYTGGFPAEYGGQMAGIINIQSKVPSGHLNIDADSYIGSLSESPNAISSNGQSLAISDRAGALGVFLSGSRQETDRRIDPPTEYVDHDHGFDYFLYGKLDYLLTESDYLTMNLNWSRTFTEIPFDSLSEGVIDNRQKTTNAFQTLSYYHTISSELDKESNLFIGLFAREGGLQFLPGSINTPSVGFEGDSTLYVLSEDRSFTTLGFRTTFSKRLSHEFAFSTGVIATTTSGTANFTTRDSMQDPGPAVTTDFTGSDFGIFLQTDIHPLEWTSIEAGLRYDQHIAPDIELQKQLSPRLKWNIFIDEATTASFYYGRLFMPINVEGLRSLAITTDGGAASGTLAERDDLYEISLSHSFDFGLTSKAAYFKKVAVPGLDDQTLGSSSIKTPVNIGTVKTDGIELGLAYRHPLIPLSATLNSSIIHAYGYGDISGGFLDIGETIEPSDLDHDQRISVSASLNYQPSDWFANLTALYGSGLTNGDPDGITFGTGLFDMNTAAHVTPAWTMNLSGGYRFRLDDVSIEPSLYITNVLDHSFLLKGQYFSGAAWSERRNIVFKLAVHL
ncbi:MAG TPA: TonB-dependent receptor [Candidatus Kapabacteria bacterium]